MSTPTGERAQIVEEGEERAPNIFRARVHKTCNIWTLIKIAQLVLEIILYLTQHFGG